MSINLKDLGRDILGGSFLGDVLYGGGGAIDNGKVGASPGGGGQPPLLSNPTPDAQRKGGFLDGVKDFINSLTDRPSTNAGAAAGAAFWEKAQPWVIGSALAVGAFFLLRKK